MATSMTPHVTHLEPNADVALLGRQQGTHDWRTGLPVLMSPRVSLRELMPSDAQSLHDLLATREVQRYMTPGPKTVRDFEQFIRWTHGARESGQYACYGVVPNGHEAAVGIFQLWPVEPGFATAEWGFALGSPLWGTGLFRDCAQLVIDFAIGTMGVRRLEARAAADNARANGALRKLGAVREGTLRRCFKIDGEYRDHTMWSILADEWALASDHGAQASSARASEPALPQTPRVPTTVAG